MNFIHNFLPRFKKRKLYGLFYIGLPIPFSVLMVTLGLSQHNRSSDIHLMNSQITVFLGYISMILMLFAFIMQVLYVGNILHEETRSSEPQPQWWKILGRYFLGNFTISITSECVAFVPIFIAGYLANGLRFSNLTVLISKFFMGIFLYVFIADLWFRYFRYHFARYKNIIITRSKIIKRYYPFFLCSLLMFALAMLFPETNGGLAASGFIISCVSLFLWELLGLGFHEFS